MSGLSVLYDAPGPRARRLTWIASTVVGLLVLAAAYLFLYRPLDAKGQFAGELWSPLLNPSNELFPLVWKRLGIGFRNTLIAAALAIVASLVVGTALAVLRLRLADLSRRGFTTVPAGAAVRVVTKALNLVTRVFVELFRGLPVVLTIVFVVRIFEDADFDLETRTYLVIGLTLYNSVVIGEILRSGMANLPPGQKEAADALGLSGLQTTTGILLPQAFRIMLPALISQVVVILKDTALGFIIGYEEALRIGQQVIQNLGNPIQVYVVIAVLYIGLNYLVSRLAGVVQRRVAQGRRTPPGARAPVVAGTGADAASGVAGTGPALAAPGPGTVGKP